MINYIKLTQNNYKMKNLYLCACCGYETNHKSFMRKHLYKKKPCPKILNTIELTDDIKEYILANHVYNIPIIMPNITINNNINQIINNNNIITNYIANMDSIEKINKIINYQDVELVEYGDTIANKFSETVKELEDGRSNFLVMDKHNLLEVIDQVSSLTDETFENMNILFDEKFNKLKLYENGEWNVSILISGIRTLLMKIKEVYFDQYECYLIRKIEYSNMGLYNKQKIKEKLIDYYKFLGCFEINPYVDGRNDTEIKYNMDDDRNDSFIEHTDQNREIPIRYMDLYVKTRDNTKKCELNKIKHDIIDIVKKNSKKNMDDLNKKVFAMFNMDEDFKKTIINT
jgi:hypothetical protein